MHLPAFKGMTTIFERSWLPFLLLAIASSVPYVNSLFNSFAWDDNLLILGNSEIRSWQNLPHLLRVEDAIFSSGSYRPLSKAMYLIDYSLWGLNPLGYHLVNNLLHIANTLLVYAVFKRIFSKEAAFFTALFFALLPVQTEAVNLISGRNTLVCTFFSLFSFLFFLSATQHSRRSIGRYLLFLFSLFLALCSKEYAVVVPALIVGYLYMIKDDTIGWWKQAALASLSSLAVILLYAVLKLWALGELFHLSPGTSPLARRMADSPAIFFTYVKLLLFPYDLRLYYDETLPTRLFSVAGVGGVMLLAVAAGMLLWSMRRRKALFFMLLWLLLPLAPVSNLVPLTGSPVALRHLYLPAVGFSLLAAHLLIRILSKYRAHQAIWLCLAVILASYTVTIFLRNRDWRNDMTLFTEELKKNPHSTRGALELAEWYMNKGEDSKAEAILKNTGMSCMVAVQLGNLYFSVRNDSEKAISYYQQAIALLGTDNYPADMIYRRLGIAYEQNNNFFAAADSYKRAIELAPKKDRYYSDLGILFLKQGDDLQSEFFLEKALAINPWNPFAHNALGSMHLSKGKINMAASEFRRAIELSPDFCEAYYNLGSALEKMEPRAARTTWSQYLEKCRDKKEEKDFIPLVQQKLTSP